MIGVAAPKRLIVQPIPGPLLKALALRRFRNQKAANAIVAVSLALATAAVFAVTAMTGTMVWKLQSRIVGGGAGASMIRKAAVSTFMPWHAVSLAAAVVALASISCVLAVSFVGRKRSLGVLKILGATNRDLVRLLAFESLYVGAVGVPLGIGVGTALVASWLGISAVSIWCYAVAILFGAVTLGLGVWLPVRLVRNANCAQLLNNRPVYAFSNPSCEKCGLCGGF
ncbi:MAG: FtsX-like permease family protein [Bacillota bacterium]|jgi:predicted lysophospholipase L1 biosynthesis ABC-type transport system permease subunit